MKYQVVIAPRALKMLEEIKDRRIQQQIQERIDALKSDPDKQGKPLFGELSGYRSVRAAGQRYRIIYRIEKGRIIVFVVALGIRKEGSRVDVYELAKRLVRLGILSH